MDTPNLRWKDVLTENTVELLETIKLEETAIKTKPKVNSNDQKIKLTADKRHQDKLLLNLIND